MAAPTTLTRRELNRATLARQMLLARGKTTALRAIERLVGLQAQLPRPPFIGLWTRLDGFRRGDLTRLLQRREVVRATLMRSTLHLMSARDYVKLRGAIQPVLTHAMRSILRARGESLDLDALVATARAHLAEEPRTFDELRDHLSGLHPKGDVRAMAYAVRCQLPLIQVPTDTAWGYPGAADFTVADAWLNAPLALGDDKPDALVLRYLAAFGPASAADAQTWSGLPKVAPVLDSIRDQLRTFRDERGRELFDLPKSPRPPADTAAPARFIPEYDNLVLSHADRTRIVADEHRSKIVTANLRVLPTFIVDGFVAGTWKIERTKRSAVLVVEPFGALTKKASNELAEEGDKLLRFVEEDAATFDVRFGGKPRARKKS